ncbi:MAG: tripartite tricarboxylate transporter TctB family protein [Lachnospiraceae bacterium]|nr:tripartite tricarboxylate transporter TctB family protein [Lachnospiraceae bacterium]
MKRNSKFMMDILPGIVIALFSIGYLSLIPKIQTFTGMGSTPLTNHFVPALWGGFLLVLALWLIVRGLRKRAAFLKEGGKIEKFDLKAAFDEKREVILSFVVLTIYVALMDAVGFVPMTILYLFAQILILTPTSKWKKTWLPALICGIICAVLFYFIFRMKLNVLLPQGILKSFGL